MFSGGSDNAADEDSSDKASTLDLVAAGLKLMSSGSVLLPSVVW